MVMENDEQRLMQLLQDQRACYARLHKLADRQRLLVAADDAAGLLSVLAERQVCVDELTRLNGSLAPYRAAWTSVYRDLSEPARGEVRGLLDECNTLLAAVMESDQRDAASLATRRELTSAALSGARSAGAAAAAYSTASRETGRSAMLNEVQA